MNKIFGLGFHKTGSTTLETALIKLGYDCVGRNDHLFEVMESQQYEQIDVEIAKHDAFRDMPWPLFYKELDERYTDAKFILTVRASDQWIASCKNHYKEQGTPEFAKIYGEGYHFPVDNEDTWTQRYEKHNQDVRDYFADKPGKFLEVNWEEGDGWEKLCVFLDKPVPERPFPHANKGQYSIFGKAIRKVWWLVDRKGFKKKNRDL